MDNVLRVIGLVSLGVLAGGGACFTWTLIKLRHQNTVTAVACAGVSATVVPTRAWLRLVRLLPSMRYATLHIDAHNQLQLTQGS